jgi:hypothetical protein
LDGRRLLPRIRRPLAKPASIPTNRPPRPLAPGRPKGCDDARSETIALPRRPSGAGFRVTSRAHPRTQRRSGPCPEPRPGRRPGTAGSRGYGRLALLPQRRGHGAGDRVLGDEGPQDATAHNNIDLVGTFLIVDDGTGPDRTLVIYEVPAARKPLATGFSVQGSCNPTTGSRNEEFSLDDKGLTFWQQVADKPTPNCPGYAGS